MVCIECLVGANGCQVAVTQWRIGLLSFPHMIMPSWEEEVSLQIVFLVLSYPYFMHQHTSTTTVVKCSSYLARCLTILIQDIYSKQRNSNPTWLSQYRVLTKIPILANTQPALPLVILSNLQSAEFFARSNHYPTSAYSYQRGAARPVG